MKFSVYGWANGAIVRLEEGEISQKGLDFLPIDPEKLLAVIEEKLEEQNQADRMSEEKVKEWIESRVRKIEFEDSKR